MTCTVCGGKTKVLDTKVDGVSIHRRRSCEGCNRVFFTVEYEVETSEKYHALRREYDRRRRYVKN